MLADLLKSAAERTQHPRHSGKQRLQQQTDAVLRLPGCAEVEEQRGNDQEGEPFQQQDGRRCAERKPARRGQARRSRRVRAHGWGG